MISICVGQEYGDNKCRLNHHLDYQHRPFLRFNINNLHDIIIVPESGFYLANVPLRVFSNINSINTSKPNLT